MQFDDNFLQEMGLSAMPEEEKQEFLKYTQTKLETCIGERVSEGLSDAQLFELDSINDVNEVANWLEQNRPDYREIVHQAIEEIKAEIRANRNQLISHTH